MEQTDLVAACERRDIGIARAGRGAGDEWTREAARFIAYFAGTVALGEAFLIETVALRWQTEGRTKPKEARAWGAAVRLASHEGWIVKTGQFSTKTSNCCAKPLWRRA